MPKRKKYPRLPSGFGSIRYLGKNRSRPYAVHIPCTDRDPKTGNYVRPSALCYASSWYVGFAVLTAYHAGTYKPGMENDIETDFQQTSTYELDDFCAKIMRNMSIATGKQPAGKTVSEVYEDWYSWKFGEHAAKKLSKSAEASTRSAYKLISSIHNRPMESLRLEELQSIVNSLNMSKSTTNNVVLLIKNLYKYAVPREFVEKDIGQYVVMPSTRDQEHHEAFTDADLKTLWKHADDPVVHIILIMCYSGFRISAYHTMEINLEDRYFRGGVKTAAGKDRIVPIHSGILPLVNPSELHRIRDHFSTIMKQTLSSLGLPELSAHSCRHTFSRLCESYGVSEADRKRMLGHSFRNDITNGVYGHRTLEELRAEIEKIQIPDS